MVGGKWSLWFFLSFERTSVSEFEILAQKWCKITSQKQKQKQMVFANYPDGGGELAGEGSMSVAVGVSYR